LLARVYYLIYRAACLPSHLQLFLYFALEGRPPQRGGVGLISSATSSPLTAARVATVATTTTTATTAKAAVAAAPAPLSAAAAPPLPSSVADEHHFPSSSAVDAPPIVAAEPLSSRGATPRQEDRDHKSPLAAQGPVPLQQQQQPSIGATTAAAAAAGGGAGAVPTVQGREPSRANGAGPLPSLNPSNFIWEDDEDQLPPTCGAGGRLPLPLQGPVPMQFQEPIQPPTSAADPEPERNNSGRLPPPKAREAPPSQRQREEEAKPPKTAYQAQVPQLRPMESVPGVRACSSSYAPSPEALGPEDLLETVIRAAASGDVGGAFRLVFRFGNESVLLSVLKQLEPIPTWRLLGDSDARYLVRLLTKLISKAKPPPRSDSREICFWFEALGSLEGGSECLEVQDAVTLKAALFSLSGSTGELARAAAAAFCSVFEPSSADPYSGSRGFCFSDPAFGPDLSFSDPLSCAC